MAIGANSVAGKITVTGEVVTKGFSDFKAKVDMAIGSATKLASALDQAIDRGGKFVNLMQANTIAIDAARAATAGLVDDYTLLSASNRAAALGIKLTSDEFAQLSKAAVVMSRKLGTDASDAVNDLITGIGRQSMAILDNLGIIVKAEDAYDRYAESIGKTASELTAVEKRTAFQSEAMRKLAEATQGGADSLNNMADNWQRLKTLITNTTDGLKAWFLQNETIGNRISSFTDMIRFYGNAFRDSTPAIDEHRKAIHKTNIEIGELLHKMGSSDADVLEAVGLAAAASALGEKPIAKTGPRAVKEVKPFAKEAGGGGSKLGAPEWNKGVMQAGEMQIAEELRAAQTAANVNAIDAEIRADNRWIDAELRKQAVLQNSITLLQDMDFAANINAQKSREWVQGINDVTAGVGEFTAGLWSAADAAITSGESFGAAVLKQVKAELMGVAARSTIAALYFTGMGFASLAGLNPISASQWFAAAGIMTAVAAAAGAGALGIASATSRSSGSASSGRGREAPGSHMVGASDSKREKEKEINVYVYLGDRYDRSAQLYMRRSAEGAAA